MNKQTLVETLIKILEENKATGNLSYSLYKELMMKARELQVAL